MGVHPTEHLLTNNNNLSVWNRMPVSSTSNGKDNSRMNGEEDSSNSDGDSSSCELKASRLSRMRTI